MYRSFIAIFVFCLTTPTSSSDLDNLAMLKGTLKTMQRAACDDEVVSLSCPRRTSISIQVAQYGKTTPEGHSCQTERPYQPDARQMDEPPCLWPNSMQYSLLQTVVEACQKKSKCKFSTRPKNIVDPCPATRKFVEVAYNCTPYEFRRLTGCENEMIKLTCNPHYRLAILNAEYGRVAYESNKCPQNPGVYDETCLAPYASSVVVQLCHGKRRCEVIANTKTFGSPCRPETKNYLKIAYTCVPLGVLTERFETAIEADEMKDHGAIDKGDNINLSDETGGVVEKWHEVSVQAIPAERGKPTSRESFENFDDDEVKLIKTDKTSLKEKHEMDSNTMVYIYAGVGVLVFLILLIIIVIAKRILLHREANNAKSPDMFTTEMPNVFNDAISDVDNDIDVSHISGTFYDPIHPDMILYRDAGSKGIRAMKPLSSIYPCSMYGNVDYQEASTSHKEIKTDESEVVVSPKSLSRFSNPQFYYG